MPYDQRRPFDPSGIRLGTPAVTNRGMGQAEVRTIGRCLWEAVDASRLADDATLMRIRGSVRELGSAFPVPGM